GDDGLLSLLKETREALPQGAILGVATPMWLPWPFSRWGWSNSYLEKVAAASDQVAIMCYDSGFWLPRNYAWLVRQQGINATRASARSNPQCRILLGLPTYGPAGLSHNPRAENIRIALKAARDAVSDSSFRQSAFAGVAIFADYTTDVEEWTDYEAL